MRQDALSDIRGKEKDGYIPTIEYMKSWYPFLIESGHLETFLDRMNLDERNVIVGILEFNLSKYIDSVWNDLLNHENADPGYLLWSARKDQFHILDMEWGKRNKETIPHDGYNTYMGVLKKRIVEVIK